MKYTISYSSARGPLYLNCIETHCCGDRVVPYFDMLPSSAIPLDRDQADKLLQMIRDEFPKYRPPENPSPDAPPPQPLSARLQVIPYPVRSKEVQE